MEKADGPTEKADGEGGWSWRNDCLLGTNEGNVVAPCTSIDTVICDTKEDVFKPARYDGGLTTVSMQVGVYRLSLLSNIDGQPSAVIWHISAWKAKQFAVYASNHHCQWFSTWFEVSK